MEISRQGCFFGVLIGAGCLLVAGWVVGAFALAPVHCSEPECARWARQADLATVASFVGLGCLVVAGLNLRPGVFLWLGIAVLGITAIAGYANPGLFVLISVNLLVVAAVGGWFLAGWMDG